MAAPGARASYPDYAVERERCKTFLRDFEEDDLDAADNGEGGGKKYLEQLQEIANRARRTLDVALDDIAAYDGDGKESLLSAVRGNTRRYASLFAEAVDELLPAPTAMHGEDDVFDVLMRQREQHETETSAGAAGDGRQQLPASLRRRYRVAFTPGPKEEVIKLREVKADKIGQHVTVRGIITRVGDVKPLMEVACYTCDECGFEIYQEVTADNFMPLQECPTKTGCRVNNRPGQLFLQTRASKFVKFQEIKIQELAEEVPMGHIPRTLTVQVKDDLVRSVSPGDMVDVSGIFLPKPFTGFRAMRAGLVANTFLEATHLRQHKKKYSQYVLTPEMKERIETLAEERDLYGKLARSIAPEIYGHEDIKKALLLLLCGGAQRVLPDGMKLRGDIHLCMMGDPGVAKSQLLKHIVSVSPRGVYTTGRGSSGAGLTAAVTRDTLTNEMVLEGGALVLADMGICCIDEFDKMDETDRTAIHEVMEQQTVSIAKAGITTTLNARTSVLAAANPVGGRYNPRWSPSENINLPAALLSRFDIMWLILDRADENLDLALARHILTVHKTNKAPLREEEGDIVSASTLRAYVACARAVEPSVPADLAEYIAAAYAEMRQEEADSGDQAHSYTTARTLLSILRLSEALARLRFGEEVSQSDVDEALRLMRMSKASLLDDTADRRRGGADPVGEIYAAIRDYVLRNEVEDVSYDQAKNIARTKGFTQEALDACLEEYAALNVWQIDPATKSVTFVDELGA